MEKSNYKISVIVAVYNAEDYLCNCCNSILAQTYRNIELILVNDGSEDNSLAICKKIQASDKRVVVIDKENGGCYSAWNKGLDVATGDFIGFVDNDDYIQPQMYETLLDILIEQDADICACNRYRNVDNINDYCNMDLTNERICVFSGYDAVVHLLSDTQYIKPAMWDKLYKSSLFETLRFPNTFFEDAAITYKLLYTSKKIAYTEKQLYAYSQPQIYSGNNHATRAAHRPACPHAPYGRCGADERGLAMVSVYPLWKADDHTGQPRRGQDLLCHASCGGLHQPKALARYGNN